jgi:hypothetical protein
MNLENLSDISRMDILRALGLTPRMRDYIWPAIGLFSTGALIGAGAALLLAPKSGAKLRADISHEIRSRLDDLERRLGRKTDEPQQASEEPTAKAAEAA